MLCQSVQRPFPLDSGEFDTDILMGNQISVGICVSVVSAIKIGIGVGNLADDPICQRVGYEIGAVCLDLGLCDKIL